MSAQGVLAVMDSELSIYEQYGLIHGRTETKHALIEARATVAELIATLEFVRDNARDDSPAMWDRVDAALARAGGAK